MRYYRLLDDINFPNRWHLSGVTNTDPWPLVSPPMISMDDPLRSSVIDVQVQVVGKPMDYTTTSQASIPIVNFKALQAVDGMGGFTVFPVRLLGLDRQQRTTYHLLQIWDVVDCIDEEQSNFEVIPKNDPIRPNLAGNYRSVTRLIIDPKRTAGKHIFRTSRLEGRVIVSEEVKKRFEAKKVKGAVFECVTPEFDVAS